MKDVFDGGCWFWLWAGYALGFVVMAPEGTGTGIPLDAVRGLVGLAVLTVVLVAKGALRAQQ